MNVSAKASNCDRRTAVSGYFFSSDHCSLGTFHFFFPLFPRKPLFPALRSSPMAVQEPHAKSAFLAVVAPANALRHNPCPAANAPASPAVVNQPEILCRPCNHRMIRLARSVTQSRNDFIRFQDRVILKNLRIRRPGCDQPQNIAHPQPVTADAGAPSASILLPQRPALSPRFRAPRRQNHSPHQRLHLPEQGTHNHNSKMRAGSLDSRQRRC